MLNKVLLEIIKQLFNEDFLSAQTFTFSWISACAGMWPLRTDTLVTWAVFDQGACVLGWLQVTSASVLHNQKALVNYGSKAEKLCLRRDKHHMRAVTSNKVCKIDGSKTYQILTVSNCSSRTTTYTCGGTADKNTESQRKYQPHTEVHRNCASWMSRGQFTYIKGSTLPT